MSEPDGDKWEGRFALFIGAVFLCALPFIAVAQAAGAVGPYTRWVLGQFGRPFGRGWFQVTKTDEWETSFLVFPPDDAALRTWLANQRGVIESSVARGEGGVRFRCVRRGWSVAFGEIRERTLEAALVRGYETSPFGVSTRVYQE